MVQLSNHVNKYNYNEAAINSILARAASRTFLALGSKVYRSQINLSSTKVEVTDRCTHKWLICVTAIMASGFPPHELTTEALKIKKKKRQVKKQTDPISVANRPCDIHLKNYLLFYRESDYQNLVVRKQKMDISSKHALLIY